MADLLTSLQNRFQEMEEYKNNFVSSWQDSYKRWANFKFQVINAITGKVIKESVRVPATFWSVETIVPKILNAVFSQPTIIKLIPTEQIDKNVALADELILNWYLKRIPNKIFKFEKFLKYVYIYGWAIAKIIFDTNNRLIDFIPINWRNIYVDPSASDFSNVRDILYICKKTETQLKAASKAGIYTNVYKFLHLVEKLENRGVIASDKYYIGEYWTKDRLITVGLTRASERKSRTKEEPSFTPQVILRNDANPYNHGELPFVYSLAILDPEEGYHMGVPYISKYTQAELDLIRTHRLDALKMNLANMYQVRRGALTKSQIFSLMRPRSGGLVFVDDMNAIKPLYEKPIPRAGYEEELMLKTDIEEVTGAYKYVRGGPPERRELATVFLGVQEMANERFLLQLMRFEDMVLVPMAKMSLLNLKQFLKAHEIERIGGIETRVLFENTRKEVRLYDYTPTAIRQAALTSRKRQELMMILQLLAQPGIAERANVYQAVKWIISEIFPSIRDIDKIMPPTQHTPELMAVLESMPPELLTAILEAGRKALGLEGGGAVGRPGEGGREITIPTTKPGASEETAISEQLLQSMRKRVGKSILIR